MSYESSNNIPLYGIASDARKAANIILVLIEKTMREKPQKFLESEYWHMPKYSVEDQDFMSSLHEGTRNLAYSWVRVVLQERGWDFDSKNAKIIPFSDHSQSDKT